MCVLLTLFSSPHKCAVFFLSQFPENHFLILYTLNLSIRGNNLCSRILCFAAQATQSRNVESAWSKQRKMSAIR